MADVNYDSTSRRTPIKNRYGTKKGYIPAVRTLSVHKGERKFVYGSTYCSRPSDALPEFS